MQPILFAGGDQRTLAALSYMTEKGYSVASYALATEDFPLLEAPSLLVLPFPAVKQGKLNAPTVSAPPTVEELIRELNLDPETLPAIGGPLENNPFTRYTDLSLSEELKLRNAVTTAEGALSLLIQNTDESVFGMSVLITGYGAIGTCLARMLSALGAKVTIAARKEKDRVAAELMGFCAQKTESISLNGLRAIINTVPARIFPEDAPVPQETPLLYLELASPPYGADRNKLEASGISYVLGAALPGKVAPRTAGEDLAKTLISLLPPLKTKGSDTPLGT